MKNPNPIAVVISDIHFSIKNLELASNALRQALKKAEDLQIPLIIAGDLNDTKAIIRAEVANELIEILSRANTPIHIMVGNHDLCNEHGNEHSLNFLRSYAEIIDKPVKHPVLPLIFIPYQSDTTQVWQKWLQTQPKGSVVIAHQGFLGAAMGEYIIDKSSISPDVVKDYTVVSGHYHKHQTLGTVTYIGSPYTVTFTEANDPAKGFLIIHKDGLFERVLTHLRKHIIVERELKDILVPIDGMQKDDVIWLKVSGARSELKKLDREKVKNTLGITGSFKLDLIYSDDDSPIEQADLQQISESELLDMLIGYVDESEEYKTQLKTTWREVMK